MGGIIIKQKSIKKTKFDSRFLKLDTKKIMNQIILKNLNSSMKGAIKWPKHKQRRE